MKELFAKMNTRLLVIHFIAFWFFIYAFQTLALLYDYDFLYLISSYVYRVHDKSRVQADFGIISQVGNVGLLVAYIISWRISLKRNWHWVNSFFIFIIAFVLYNLGYLGWNFLQFIFTAPGNVFPAESIWKYVTNGIIMLAIGSLLLFSKKIIRYIDHKNPSPVLTGNKADRKAAAKARMSK